MAITSEFIDRLIERLDLLDPQGLQGWLIKLVRQKGLLDTIFQTIHEGVLIIDRNLKLHFVNIAAINLLGLPVEIKDRENQTINRYLKDLDWDRLMSLGPQERGRASRQEIEIFYPFHRYLQVYLFPYKNEFDEDSKLGLTIIILHDVTEFKKNVKSTIESERTRTMTMLAAGVAHEIGNPLNSLTIHLQLLERYFDQHLPSSAQDEARQSLDVATQEVKRLDRIISRFVKAIRPVTPEFKSLSLKDLIGETIKFMSKEIEDRGVFVECTFPKDMPTIVGDETQLKQAFYNVITNAIQAMSADGLLKISFIEKSDSMAVVFSDDGKGISPDELGNIFNPYYTTKKDGSGLGLMIVERIISEHGGELGVESDVGLGTRVTIKLLKWGKKTRLLKPYSEKSDTTNQSMNR